MLHKRLFIALVGLLLLNPLFAQRKISQDDIDYAQSLKKKYKDDDFAITNSELNFTFSLIKSKTDTVAPIVTTEHVKETILALKPLSSTYGNGVYFDHTSSVTDFINGDKLGRPISGEHATSIQTIEQDGIFYSDAKVFYYAVVFQDEGAYHTIQYAKKYNDIKYVTSVYFCSRYPVLNKTITFEVPTWLDIELKEMNFEGNNIVKTTSKNPKTGATIYTYTAKNLQQDKSESHEPGDSFIMPHLLILAKSYTSKEGKKEMLFNSADNLYNWYHSLVKRIGNKNDVLKPLVTKLTTAKATDQDKIEAIFYWVQDNIRYIAFEDGIAGFKPEACQSVYNNKYGDCKGMANLLKEMLTLAGYDARLTWLGTRRIAYDYSTPCIAVDNHMICTVLLKGTYYYLDPTETFISFGDLAHRIQGRQVIIENGESFIMQKTPEYSKDRNLIKITTKASLNGDMIEGKTTEEYNGEGKTQILRGYSKVKSDKKDDAIKHFLSGQDKNMSIQNINTSNLQERKNKLLFDYNFTLKNQVVDVDNEKYVTLDYNPEMKNMTIDTASRTKDYVYGHKYYLVKQIDFTVPTGLKVKYLPKGFTKTNPDFSFAVNYKTAGNKITYTKTITIDNAIIHKKDFKDWNGAIKELKRVYNDQIILSK